MYRVAEHLRSYRQKLYVVGAVVIVMVVAVMAFWFFATQGSKDADVKKIVSLGIQGKRQLNVGEKTVLRVGSRLSDGSETDVTKNLDWHSSDDSVVAVRGDGQVEARKDGFADITVRYEGIASPPLTLVVKGESRSTEADAARVVTKVQEHIKTAGSYRDRGEYSTALTELAKAEALDPANKSVQAELERTKEAKRRGEAEAKRREEDKRRADEEKRRQAEPVRRQEEAKQRAEEPQKKITTPVFIPPIFGGGDPDPNYTTVRVFFATDRKRMSDSLPANMFGLDRASLSYGTCEVSIPRDHRMGALEAPSVLRFEFRQDPERHIVLLRVSLLDKSKYFADLSVRIKKSVRKDAFIFVHGYNVTFADAARRTAQMAYDLGFGGAPVFYSWPSQGSLLRYTVDEANNEWTQSNLKQFLDDFTSKTDAENIFLIGHGMGNRALTRAFGQLVTEKPTLRNKFREVILSAPDIDAEVFKRDIVPQIVPATLYASSTDEALTRSKKFHQYARAGDAGAGLVIVGGIDTIDATNVATDFLGHSYFAESRSVISDLFYLIKDGKRAQDRFGLVEGNTAAGRYWVFKR